MTHHSLSLHRYEGRHLKLVGTLFGLTQENVIFLEMSCSLNMCLSLSNKTSSSSHELAPMVKQLAIAGFKQTSDSCLLACIEYEPDEFSLRLEIQELSLWPISTL